MSEVDRDAERAIVEGIVAARPDDAILGEEGTDRAGTSGVRWVVDPLDGTANFVTGYPAYSVSIGVEVGGEPVLGVVNDSARGVVYVGVRGAGATREGVPVEPSRRTHLSEALVGTGFAYSPARRLGQAETLRAVLPRIADIRRGGAASLELCAVACGELDAYYELNLEPWDVAAGAIIARAAGARAQRFAVAEDERGLTVAAPPALFDPLLALLREAGMTFLET